MAQAKHDPWQEGRASLRGQGCKKGRGESKSQPHPDLLNWKGRVVGGNRIKNFVRATIQACNHGGEIETYSKAESGRNTHESPQNNGGPRWVG